MGEYYVKVSPPQPFKYSIRPAKCWDLYGIHVCWGGGLEKKGILDPRIPTFCRSVSHRKIISQLVTELITTLFVDQALLH